MEQNLTLDPKKVNTIKLRILELETENIVKKESNPAMEEKIRKMIIVKYQGGLGNQMFQYAMQLSLIHKYKHQEIKGDNYRGG